MAMSLAAIQAAFKDFGKMVKGERIATLDAPSQKSAWEKLGSAAVDQSTSGVADEFDAYNLGVKPFATAIATHITALTALPTTFKNNMQSYLTKVTAVDLGLASGATVAAVGTQLVADMNTAGATVEPSGTGGSNDDGFAVYFATNFNITLPQDPSPNVPDSYITDTVV